MPFEAVLVDMDGVLIDTQQSILAFWQRLAAEFHIQITTEDIDEHISGRSAQHTITTLLPQLEEHKRQSIYRALHDYEASLQYQEVDGATYLLKELQHYHIPVALVTGASRWKVKVVVEQLGLDPFFTTLVTGDDVQESKPAPESYLLAAHHLGREPQTCLVFEDAVNGVLAALAAQMVCVGVLTTAPAYSLKAAGASCTIPDFTAIRVQAASSVANRTDVLSLKIAERVFCFPLKGLY
jgi:HAD superfamily hydrolase (TIGR01549 family)